ncbi:YjdF family protein [Anaerococcus vaginalis]|uniref:YjdF family protein n=1 Tax=Anaerococcus vaginalis TaxID=33037 RepID=UPI002902A21D|nr:YjdF family protein [Anaerococcus vaginalis]MDU2649127.1 YjdF family protein [Anaerococcus vaginalis]
MNKVKCTVFFEDPFWVGVFERNENGKLSVAKVTFGAEPKDCEILDFVLKHYYDLQFSPAVAIVVKETKKNPKRAQREVRKEMKKTSIGTKSQQALKLQQEQNKQQRKVENRERNLAKAQRKFELKQKKKKEKHRGH